MTGAGVAVADEGRRELLVAWVKALAWVAVAVGVIAVVARAFPVQFGASLLP